ncbi:hypothetical protein B1813_18440 [Saccharomonospora piscinae]|uniref:Aminotransferase n=1 Tax=Saccharomonospora piscinae TaxID=687388 RepID=A0A1V8ZY76_SACPI|nr:pyridoxal phosphate-dependent aminotransferase [Saccharomonospora piscinae]OQO89832.1 hypothetical protein B1813_18440 [Saccharomonospora piscinae]
MRAARRTQRLPTGGLTSLLGAGREYGAVDLAVGTPEWPAPPENLVAQAASAVAGYNQYESPEGVRALREQIAAALGAAGDPVDPETELTVTVGASEGLCVALLSVVDPGDEVIVFEPSYENFLGGIALSGGCPRWVRADSAGRVDPDDLAAAFGPRTKAVVVNTPNNPTGHVLTREELDVLGALCERHDTTVISDEVYARYVFDGRRHVSVAEIPSLRDRSVVVGSLSKSHAISGWRIGFVRANPALSSVLRRVHIATTAGAAGPLQRAVVQSGALTERDWDPTAGMQRNRDRVVELFSRAGLECLVPEGGCYVLADIRPVTERASDEFAKRLLVEAGIVVAPGRYFFGSGAGGDELVRIAFNRRSETLDEVERRLAAFGTVAG